MSQDIQFKNAKVYYITTKEGGSCLDVLTQHLPQAEWAKQALQAGGVWCNRKRVTDPHMMLSPKQTLKVYLSNIQHKRYALEDQRIVYEDERILVVNKPSGLTAVSDRSCTTYNMTYGVQQYYKSKKIPYDPTPINRLDFMVSGLMLFAKSKADEKTLFQLSQQCSIHKYYVARLEKKDRLPRCLRIQDKLLFTNKCRVSEEGKASHSLFIHRCSTDAYEEYGVVLLTGRRHQIRCHAAHYLSPLCEDSLYGKASAKDPKPIGLYSVGLNFQAFGRRYRLRLSV